MIAGNLNELIEIYSMNIIKNDVGELVNEKILKNKTRAKLIHNNGNRAVENNEIVYNYNKTFEVRMYVDIKEFDLIKWNNKYYRVLGIEPNKELQKIIINTELVNE